jgi:putative membrane protein
MKRTCHYQIILGLVFLAAWIWSGINPATREGWMNETWVMFAAVPLLIFLTLRFRLSDLSVTFFSAILIGHVIGSHFTYVEVPFGYVLGAWMDTRRNMYDRLMHFTFGLLLAYPIQEILVKMNGKRNKWSYFLPVDIVLSLSAFFEILEYVVVLFIRPEATDAFMGAPTDFWDATKDMLNAVVGALVAMTLIRIYHGLGAWRRFRDQVEAPKSLSCRLPNAVAGQPAPSGATVVASQAESPR